MRAHVLGVMWIGLIAPVIADAQVAFETRESDFVISVNDKPFARYVFKDPAIPRPYFCDVYAPDGTRVTRNHPPIEGVDRTDHATYHPGIWLAFGDISGADFWRNKASVVQEAFVVRKGEGNTPDVLQLTNRYESANAVICSETCSIRFIPDTDGCLILWESTFENPDADFTFGDQEEMGLGVRVASPIAVINGGGMRNAEGLENEEGVWGKPSAWCDYSAVIDGRRTGIVLMTHPGNFRPSWFHARDYGLLVANPFGQNAFTEGEKSAVTVKAGDKFVLRFGIQVYSTAAGAFGPGAVYNRYLEQSRPR